ncbi:MAG: hypothetical protein H6631_06810 [Anaerolineaceae bacterium]|nr:hypothetical protein [Anaerolineaceae bacterium]MCB9099548.1 hypothetical protein [Anaerolineales bacterium]
MLLQKSGRIWPLMSALLLVVGMGCSLLARLPIGRETKIEPTRTPLPTFTATAVAQVPVSILPTPTAFPTETPTPAPLPTEPPPPPEPAAVEPTEEPPTSEPAPTDPPPPPVPQSQPEPTEAPPPTEPPPPSEPSVGANGVIGKIEFRDGRDTYSVGEKIFVKIEAKLPGEKGQKPFGVLGLTASTGAFQTSWSSGTIDGVFRHEDGLALNAPGNHKIWLSICFSALEVCQGPDGNWERFEPGLDVIVQ